MFSNQTQIRLESSVLTIDELWNAFLFDSLNEIFIKDYGLPSLILEESHKIELKTWRNWPWKLENPNSKGGSFRETFREERFLSFWVLKIIMCIIGFKHL